VEVLPEGFLERTKERGMVWPSRVPQMEILGHPALGAFVTHCGWNSIMESLWFGVPMIPWPIYAEQHLNAFEMVSEMHVTVDLKMDRKKNNFVKGDELERAIRCLIEEDSETGRRVRAKAEELKAACRKAVEQGGSSHVTLQRLTEKMGTVKQ
jgi:UDP:flavonoid glycosyltransferase YjiC (YdhE family)